MNSITKRKLSQQEAEVLVKKAFGRESGISFIQELEDGWFNAIYLIRLDSNREVVLKIAPTPGVKVMRYEKNIMKAEVEVMRLLKERCSVPVPEVYYYDNTGSIIENEYFFMEKINGQPYNKIKSSLSEEQKSKVEIELGKYNKVINNIKGTKFGLIVQGSDMCDSWSDAFYKMVYDVLTDGREYDVKLPMEYDEIESLFLERRHFLESIKETSLVHWDLHDGNIFVDKEDKITGLIDFERAMWGDPLIEFYFGDFTNKVHFCEGYGESELGTYEGKVRRVMYNVYLYLIMVIECKYRNFDNEGHIKWTYSNLENELNKLKTLL